MRAGVEGALTLKIAASLIDLTRAQIIHRGIELGVAIHPAELL